MIYPSCRVWVGTIETECSYWTPNSSWNGSCYCVEYLVCIPALLELEDDETLEEWHQILEKLSERFQDSDD